MCVFVGVGRSVSVSLRSLFLLPTLKDEEGIGMDTKSKCVHAHLLTPFMARAKEARVGIQRPGSFTAVGSGPTVTAQE